MSSRATPTIRQLAALAGVSRTTVSLSLRNHPSIPSATRERIRRLAEAQGYRIDPLVATLMNRLRTTRSQRAAEKLVYLTSWPESEGWRVSPNDVAFFEGARDRAAHLGYELEHIWAKAPGLSGERLSKILYTRGIRGVIIAPLLHPKGHFSLAWPHFATATISYTITRPLLHRSTHSHYEGMRLALHRLKQLGFRRVGFANLLDQEKRVSHAWQAAYYVHYHGQPPARRIPPLIATTWDKRELSQWVEEHRPDVVLSNQLDPLSLLREAGFRCPQDLGFACLDLPVGDVVTAGINQAPHAVATAAVDLVVTQLQNNEFGLPSEAKTVQLEGTWRNGETLLPTAENDATDSTGIPSSPKTAV